MSGRNTIVAGIVAALGFGLVAIAVAPEVGANYSDTVKVPVHVTISIPPTQPGPLPPPGDHSTEPTPSSSRTATTQPSDIAAPSEPAHSSSPAPHNTTPAPTPTVEVTTTPSVDPTTSNPSQGGTP